MTRTQSRITVLLVAMLAILCIMVVGTSYSHATTVMTVTDGQKITQNDVNKTDYFKFKSPVSGSLMFTIGGTYEDSAIYIKTDGKYKKLVNDNGGFLFVTKGKYYYVKYRDLELLDPSTEVYIDGYNWKDGGSTKSKAKTVKFDQYPEDVTGYMTYYDGANDWYKFKITKTQKVNLQVLAALGAPRYKAANTVTLYKGSKQIESKKLGTKTVLFAKKLSPGTYYVKVKRGSKLNNMRFSVTLCKGNYKWIKNPAVGDDPAMAADYIKKKIK